LKLNDVEFSIIPLAIKKDNQLNRFRIPFKNYGS